MALASGPMRSPQLTGRLRISQPTLSRAIVNLGRDAVRIRVGRTFQYALRDGARGIEDCPVYRVDEGGRISQIGTLIPVRNDGFVMCETSGPTLFSEGIPWWLLDMRPQGYMGRAYAARHAQALGLPTNIREWSDSQSIRALIAHGHDATGNLLLGDLARARFLHSPDPVAVPLQARGEHYTRLARQVAGDDEPWSSAAGEQPKFAVYSESLLGCRHRIVKFTQPDENPVTQRWRDLLLAEHHALETLAQGGVAAARTEIIDYGGQRFLEVERFDRIGMRGRMGLFSLGAVDAEFTGMAKSVWPVVAKELATLGHIQPDASDGTALLYAFGTLIGNTDMHEGNLSFVSHSGRPYALAPAYDMLPMAFQPRSGGGLSNTLSPATLHATVALEVWQSAMVLAINFLERIRSDSRFSEQFAPCLENLSLHVQDAQKRIARLGN